MFEMIKEFIKPELIVLIPVLYICGAMLKKSSVKNKDIPFLLGVASATLSLMYIIATTDMNGYKDAFLAIFSGITQGVLCAGASVYANQLIKQKDKDE